jgi:UDP-N-acetylglucosamine transferase subunit ALG13
LATVGTHEDPFDRLLQELDRLVEVGEITEPVFCQSGYCTYVAKHVECVRQLPFDELQQKMRDARIVITHGGPATIMQALAHGKVPMVVPRQAEFGEHVDNHQVRFARKISDRVIPIIDIAELGPYIATYEERVAKLPAGGDGRERARDFAGKLGALCDEVLTRPRWHLRKPRP